MRSAEMRKGRVMKQLLGVLVVVLPTVLCAQTNVERLWRTLDSLNLASVNDWKMSPDLGKGGMITGDPRQAGFDDSGWTDLKLNENTYVDSCWIRKEIVLPERRLGEPVHGMLKLLVSVDDYGYMWINGKAKGHFPWDGEFILTEEAKAGERIVVAILAVNTGGPLRLLRARIQGAESRSLEREIDDFVLGLRSAEKLLGFDTYQTNSAGKFDPGIDRSRADRNAKERLQGLLQEQAARVDVWALADGRVEDFRRSLDSVRAALLPVREYVKSFTLLFNANAHIDAAWLWRKDETIEVCANTFTSVLNMMDARPDFTYTQSAAAYYDWMERLRPEIFRRIQRRVNDGRWEIVGGMWIEPDCNLIGGESWNRQLLYAKKYLSSKFGVNVRIGWNPDSFGYNWNMPMFYRMAGIDAFVTQKIGWNDTNVFPHRLFWWTSPDGSKILAYFPFDYVNEVSDPYRLIDWLRQYEANTGFQSMMVLFGVGDHGGGPTDEMLDRIERLRGLDLYPTIVYGTAEQYLDWLKSQDLSEVPVWNDELYLEYHRGTYTTQARTKAQNRLSEQLLTNAEKFSLFASAVRRPYNGLALEEAWREVLFNQFHDILPGSSIREVYADADELYARAHTIARYELESSLKALAARATTNAVAGEFAALVFNSLGWERTDLATVPLPEGSEEPYVVLDETGTMLPSQTVQTGPYRRELLFVARGVPPFGYRTYTLRIGAPGPTVTALTAGGTTMENGRYRLKVDSSTGWISSITDKKLSEELLSGPGNALQVLEDRPRAWDAWNIGLTGVEYPTTFRSVEIVEGGPVRTVLRVRHEYRKPGTEAAYPTKDFPTSFFTQDIILYTGIDRIDFRTSVDWWEAKTMLKVAFPLTVRDTSATYEIPYGTIRRTTQRRNSLDSARFEVSTHRWADLSNGKFGVSLLNRAKYGYDTKGSTMRISLLRSPLWPDPTADRGKHTIDYSLVSHTGRWDEAGIVRMGYEYNFPLLVVTEPLHGGVMSAGHSFLSFECDGAILTTAKKAEESDAWVLQWYDAEGKGETARLRFERVPSKVVRSDLLETDGEALPVFGKAVTVPTPRHSVVTLKVYF
jgi:alpha-mannosidase